MKLPHHQFIRRCFSSKDFSVNPVAVQKSNPVKTTIPLPPLPTVAELVKLYRVRAAKHLAQNFLFDPAIVNRIVSCIGPTLDGQHCCEIGPGPGAITRGILLKNVDRLTVVEKDPRFMPLLKYIGDVVEGRLQIVQGDILDFDLHQVFPSQLGTEWSDENLPPFSLIGNLPFNISLPLLFRLLDSISNRGGVFEHGRVPMVFTFQLEVAERIAAEAGHPQRSRVSITTQNYCHAEYRFNIAGKSFIPPPKVDVGVVKLTPRITPLIDLPFKKLDKIVKHCLHNRKKKCEQGIRTLFPPKRKDLVDELFQVSGVSRSTKGFELELSHFRDICYAFQEIENKVPHLDKVDTYDPNVWKKFYDADGNPLDLENV